MTTWHPDTCDCIIEFNKNVNWIRTIKICKLHKSLRGQNLLETVLAQNRRFNNAHGLEPIKDSETLEITDAKAVNKMRIRIENLTDFHEHLPEHHTPTFFENLKRILRSLNPF